MHLKYVKEPLAKTLRDSAEQNLKRYSEPTPWLMSHPMASSNIGDTGLEVERLRPLEMPTGGSGESMKDLENTKLLYSDLKSLTTEQAHDQRLWAYLTHVQYWDYMRARWDTGNKASVVIRRYLFEGNNNDSLIRNGISRLWWFGFLTYDQERVKPFELTETLLLNQDIQQALLERNFGRNRNLLHVTLEYIRQNESQFRSGNGMTVNVQALGKNINMLGGVTLLDGLDRKAMAELVRDAAGISA